MQLVVAYPPLCCPLRLTFPFSRGLLVYHQPHNFPQPPDLPDHVTPPVMDHELPHTRQSRLIRAGTLKISLNRSGLFYLLNAVNNLTALRYRNEDIYWVILDVIIKRNFNELISIIQLKFSSVLEQKKTTVYALDLCVRVNNCINCVFFLNVPYSIYIYETIMYGVRISPNIYSAIKYFMKFFQFFFIRYISNLFLKMLHCVFFKA